MWPVSCGPASVMRLLALVGNISGDGTLAVAALVAGFLTWQLR
jgi:hypothetical protein